jgi:hypothetical protein
MAQSAVFGAVLNAEYAAGDGGWSIFSAESTL